MFSANIFTAGVRPPAENGPLPGRGRERLPQGQVYRVRGKRGEINRSLHSLARLFPKTRGPTASANPAPVAAIRERGLESE